MTDLDMRAADGIYIGEVALPGEMDKPAFDGIVGDLAMEIEPERLTSPVGLKRSIERRRDEELTVFEGDV